MQDMKRWHRGEGFVLIQAALLLLVFWSGRRGKAGRARRLGAGFMLGGVTLGLLSGRTLGHNLTPLPYPIPQGELVTRGAYAHLRHPIYTALLLLCSGFGLWRGSRAALAYTALLALLFDRKAAFEEQKLAAQYPEYREYQRRVGKFWPRLSR